MVKITVYKLAIFSVILFSVLTALGQNSRKVVNTKPKTPTSNKSTIPAQPCFSDKQLDFKAEMLPPNYQGNDLKKLADEIIRRTDLKKDEFETTTQFQQRIEDEKKKHLLGELNSSSTFAFEISDTTFQYDADKQIMNAVLNMGSSFTWRSPCNTNSQTVSILFLYKDSVPISLSFNMEIAKAKLTKQNLKTLFIGNLYKFSSDVNIKLFLREIWIYDVVTGEIFLKRVDLEKIRKDAEKKQLETRINSCSISPLETETLLIKAQSNYKDGRDEEAMTALRCILVSEPMSAEAYLLLGKIHLRRGDLEQAVSSLKAALFWDGRLIDAHIVLGKIYLEKGDCLQAKNYLASALAIDSENQDAKDLQKQVEKCSR